MALRGEVSLAARWAFVLGYWDYIRRLLQRNKRRSYIMYSKTWERSEAKHNAGGCYDNVTCRLFFIHFLFRFLLFSVNSLTRMALSVCVYAREIVRTGGHFLVAAIKIWAGYGDFFSVHTYMYGLHFRNGLDFFWRRRQRWWWWWCRSCDFSWQEWFASWPSPPVDFVFFPRSDKACVAVGRGQSKLFVVPRLFVRLSSGVRA